MGGGLWQGHITCSPAQGKQAPGDQAVFKSRVPFPGELGAGWGVSLTCTGAWQFPGTTLIGGEGAWGALQGPGSCPRPGLWEGVLERRPRGWEAEQVVGLPASAGMGSRAGQAIARKREGSTGPVQRIQEGRGQGNDARTAGDSWFSPMEYGGPAKAFGPTQGRPQTHPNQARHSLTKARKLPVLLVLPRIHHILRNAVKSPSF